MNKKESTNGYGFKFFVICDDFDGKAYDVPARDEWLIDSMSLIGGFYSSDVAFATAQAINNGVIKISEL